PVATVAPPPYPITPYGVGYPAVMAFGQAPPAPAPAAATTNPTILDKTKDFLSTPSVAGLTRGQIGAVGLGLATIIYGATSHWFGLTEPKKESRSGGSHASHSHAHAARSGARQAPRSSQPSRRVLRKRRTTSAAGTSCVITCCVNAERRTRSLERS